LYMKERENFVLDALINFEPVQDWRMGEIDLWLKQEVLKTARAAELRIS